MSQDASARLMHAFQKHQSGDYVEAERLYREMLAADPRHLDACQLLGAVLIQDNRPEEAIPYIRQAIAMRPDVPQYHVNLGTAYSRTRDLAGAVDCYQQAIRLKPQYFDAQKNLGSVLIKQHRFAEAVAPLREAQRLNPKSVDVQLTLGISLLKSGRHEEAVPQFEAVLQQSPHHRQALAGLGQSLMHGPNPTERAVECWHKLLDMEPENPAIHNNLATILKNAKQFAEAEAACRRALELKPGFFPALCNLGMIMSAEGRFEEACACLEDAVATVSPDPDAGTDASPTQEDSLASSAAEAWSEFGAVAYCQLAAVRNVLGRVDAAHEAIVRALEIDPDSADSRMMRGFLNLETGKLELGWPDYEWRRKGKQPPRRMPGPEWTGESLPGQTILLHAEQGLGDTIHFVRYAQLVKQRVGRVLLLSHRPLAQLMRSCAALDMVVADGDPLPLYDVHLPLLSLPHIFQTSLETVPAEVPYLAAKPELAQYWKQRLAELPGIKVGICWQGNRDFAYDRYRSVPLEHFGVLAAVPGVTLVSLQKGDGTEQLHQVPFSVQTYPEMDQAAGAFMDTAAIMQNLDLVITSDTAVPHLAGALGVPVWMATSCAAEWRWLLERADNPWYPTMRLFRQSTMGDWAPVFERMRDELAALVASRRPELPTLTAIPVGISPGELLDKITILEIKLARMTDAAKLANVRFELDQLQSTLAAHLSVTAELSELAGQLRQANEQLWDIEDAIRDCEREQTFDAKFIELARSVYITNDRRAALKREINTLLRSAIVEEKSYAEYAPT